MHSFFIEKIYLRTSKSITFTITLLSSGGVLLWKMVILGDCSSNPGGGENLSSLVFESQSHSFMIIQSD